MRMSNKRFSKAPATWWRLVNKDNVTIGEGPTRTAALLSAHSRGNVPTIFDSYVEGAQ